jgi:hypothetical protein
LRIAPQWGLPAAYFAPQSFSSLAAAIAQRNVPAKAPSGFVTLTTACLIARGMISWKSSPGDCGSPTRVDLTNVQLTQEAGNVAMGIAAQAGASIPGLGPAIQAIQEIFAHHAQAVANEQATICRVAGVINQVFRYYDTQVLNGDISPSSAYAGIQAYLGQVNEQLQSIEKSCNAACVWQGVLAAHADFVESYYPAIAPKGFFSHAPGAAPSNDLTTPGGVVQVGGAHIALPGGRSLNFTGGEVFAGFAVILFILVILFAGVKP